MAKSSLSWRMIAGMVMLSLAVIGGSLYIYWDPENQVRTHFEELLSEMASKDWDEVSDLIDDSYADRWGFTKERALRESREVLNHFYALEITAENPKIHMEVGSARVTAQIRLAGSGTPLAEMAKSEANGLSAPFEFEWRKMSGKPWDWKLVRIDHPDLNPDAYGQ